MMTDRIKVLVVSPSDPNQAASMPFINSQVMSLTKMGNMIRVFHLRSRTSPKIICQEMCRFRQEIKAFDPDIIHAQFGTMTAFFCALGTRKPLLITFQGSDLNPAPGVSTLRNKVGHVLSQISALKAKRIICVSEQLKNRLLWNRVAVDVYPMGIDMQVFVPMPLEQVRSKLGWSMEESVIIFNVRDDPVGKGLDLAQASVREARKKIPKLRIHLFEGKTPPAQMPLYYNAANCLLMTSYYEGSPMVIKEALACNLPVVSVEVGDVPQRLQGVFPSKIAARNPKALAEALVEVLASARRSNGREAVGNLSLEIMTEKVFSVYKKMLNL